MREIAGFGGRLIVHAEDAGLISGDDWHSSRYPDFLATRPPESETTAISTLIAAARGTGCRTHIVHLSAADALPEITAAREAGAPLTVETCPHYLTLAAEDIDDGATQFKCCPPVRGRANAERLWTALSDGVIDFVVTDHSPSTPELKALDIGDFGTAWGGISSLQLGLSLVWTGARERGLALQDVIGWMSSGPARVMDVEGKGAILAGNDADLVVFAPDEVWTVDVATLHHRNAVSPYHGRQVRGAVRATYLGGRRADLDLPALGRFLLR
jgi:allantoinase